MATKKSATPPGQGSRAAAKADWASATRTKKIVGPGQAISGARRKALTTVLGQAETRTQGAAAKARAHITRMLEEVHTKNEELSDRVGRLLARLS